MDRVRLAAFMADDALPTLDDLLGRPSWMADAACREHPELSWFATRAADIDAAADVCSRCLVRADCAEYAASSPVALDGIWGGMDGRTLRRLRAA